MLSTERLQQYASDIWTHIKTVFISELSKEDSKLLYYLNNSILDFSRNLKTNTDLRNNMDAWVRQNTYRFLLKNTDNVSALVSNTVGNWEGRELSRKLELEVGKDLQYIRINGTLVGGLVGLAIYAITQWL